MRRMLTAAAIALLTSGVCNAVVAQQAGSVTGRVRQSEGTPVANARVYVAGIRREQATSADGSFRFNGLPAGTHRVIVEYVGMKPDTSTVSITAGRVSDLDVVLTLSPIVLKGLEVTGERGAQLRALNQQRLSQTVINGPYLDEVGGESFEDRYGDKREASGNYAERHLADDATVTQGMAMIAIASTGPGIHTVADTVRARTERLDAREIPNAGVQVSYHSVTFRNSPTRYALRLSGR